jgi:hypothetical protein
MLEKLEFQRVVEETLTVKRVTRAMSWYQFVLAMVLALMWVSRGPTTCDSWNENRC